MPRKLNRRAARKKATERPRPFLLRGIDFCLCCGENRLHCRADGRPEPITDPDHPHWPLISHSESDLDAAA